MSADKLLDQAARDVQGAGERAGPRELVRLADVEDDAAIAEELRAAPRASAAVTAATRARTRSTSW